MMDDSTATLCGLLLIYFAWAFGMIAPALPLLVRPPERQFPPALSTFDGRPAAELQAAIKLWDLRLERERRRGGLEPFHSAHLVTYRWAIDQLRKGLAAREAG